MEKNIKLYPFYKMFAFNILFIGAISILFFIDVKGLNLYQIGIITSAFYLFSIIFQIPSAILCDRIGLKNTMLLGNLFLLLYVILLMLLNGFVGLILVEACCALGYALSGCSESPFLYSSLKRVDRTDEFSRVESIGYTYHFFLMAITYVAAGYLYNSNHYLPLILAAFCLVISNVVCFFFDTVGSSLQKTPLKEFSEELRFGFKFVFNSKRLRALMLFSFLFIAILNVSDLLMRAYLNNINSLPIIFGYFFAGFSIISALGSLFQKKIESTFKNKTLSFIGIYYIMLLTIVGIVMFFFVNPDTLLVFGILLFLAMAIIRGAYFVIIQDYLARYTTSAIRTKIQSIYNLTKSLGSLILLLITSYCLKVMSLSFTFVILGFSLFIFMILITIYMDSRAGLEPGSYTTEDRLDILENIEDVDKQ